MHILSFCRDLEFTKALDCEVVTAMEEDIPSLQINSALFQGILVDDTEILKLLKSHLSHRTQLTVPVIMLVKQEPSYREIRDVLKLGASDFCMFPFHDLKEILIQNYMKLDDLLESAEGKLNELRKSLLHTIPHEFNTPLTSIMGLASLMSSEPVYDTSMIKDYSTNILKAVNRLQKVIDNFIYYSHLQIKLSSACEIELARSFKLTRPDAVIHEVVNDLEKIYNRKIKHSLGSGKIQCNETNFYQLVYYLLENALKFSDLDCMVMVGAHNFENEYQVIVYNEGSGIDQEQLKYLGAFTQFDRESQEQQGMGFGLAIVKSLVKLYNGQIKIISEKNKYIKIELHFKT